MAVIKIVNFGGLLPKSSARAIPDNGAQRASDLLSGITEFRPLGQDTTVVANSGVTGPLTLHRLSRTAAGAFNTDMTTGWIVRATSMNFVKGQLNDDSSERTFATFNDGTAPPRAYDASDLTVGRQLGVPAPVSAPTLVVNIVDEFTHEERAGGIEDALLFLRNNAANFVVEHYRSDTFRPGSGTAGYADRATIAGADPQKAQQLRLYRFSSVGSANNGTLSDGYTGNTVNAANWIFDPSLGGFWKTATVSGWPTWAGTSSDHWCIPFEAYGRTFDINPALNGTLAAMEMPGAGNPLIRLFTAAQVTAAIAQVQLILDNQLIEVQPKLDAMQVKVTALKGVLDGGSAGAIVAALTAFYAKAEITTLFANAVANAAEAMYGEAVQAALFVDVDPNLGAGP